MSDREEFEKWYDETTNCNYGVAYYVDVTGRYCHHDIEIAWQAWQAARAQSGQGAEPVFWWDGDLSDLDDCVSKEQSAYHTIPLYTHPQPTQQGGVPSRDDLVQCLLATRGQSEGVAADAILWLFSATTPQPEGDGWVKCSERLPEQLNREYLVRVNSQIHSRPRMFVAEYSEYGFDRSKVTHWMPLPQPPQEGEGNE